VASTATRDDYRAARTVRRRQIDIDQRARGGFLRRVDREARGYSRNARGVSSKCKLASSRCFANGCFTTGPRPTARFRAVTTTREPSTRLPRFVVTARALRPIATMTPIVRATRSSAHERKRCLSVLGCRISPKPAAPVDYFGDLSKYVCRGWGCK
jgi:hypothetical protein